MSYNPAEAVDTMERSHWLSEFGLDSVQATYFNNPILKTNSILYLFVPCTHLLDIAFQNIIQTGLVCLNL